MKASDLLVSCLENEGVEYIFGIPGEENLDLLESLRRSKVKLILTRHEQGAGFIAALYAKVSGKTGVCLSTLGPGATNFTTAISFALLGGIPMLFITGQKPIKKSKQGRFQILDIVSIFKPITKLSKQIVDGNNIPYLVRECFRLSQDEKPGPVHLELPEDVAAEEVDRTPFKVTEVRLPMADPEALAKAALMIAEARHPLVLIAAGANRQNTCPAIRSFIDQTGLYFFTTQMGKGAVDERHPHCLGTTALSEKDYIHCAIGRADLIVNVGHDVSEKPPFFMRESKHLSVIHMGYYPAEMDDIYFPQHEVIGNLSVNLEALGTLVRKTPQWDASYFESVKKDIDRHVFQKSDAEKFPNIPQRIVSDIRAALPDEGILSLDNGMYKLWFARNFRAYGPNTVLLDNALASMGAGLAGAIGAKLAQPKRPVVAVCGDGGFMMNAQELETAIRLKLDLVIVILRDNSYGMIKWKQTGMDLPDFGLDFGNPDFVKFAESFSAKGIRITRTGQLAETIATCLQGKGVYVLEVPIDYSENEKVFLEELVRKTCHLTGDI